MYIINPKAEIKLTEKFRDSKFSPTSPGLICTLKGTQTPT